MEATREVLAQVPGGGGGVVFTQRANPDGTYTNLHSRRATPDEIREGRVLTIPQPDNMTVSGSHNTHARLAPSASKQWSQCTASLAFIEANRHRVPEDKGSIYAQEGTEAHDWAAKVLLKQIQLKEVPEDFRPHVGAYVEHCRSLEKGAHTVRVEEEVPLFYQPDQTGTCDFAAVSPTRVVGRDLKYGAGVLVKSEENTQLAIYVLSLIRHMEKNHGYQFSLDTEVDLAVFQPRHHEGAEQDPWVITLADLELFGAELEVAANRATAAVEAVLPRYREGVDRDCGWVEDITERVVFAPGEGDEGACRWCPAKAFCDRRLDEIASSLPNTDPRKFIECMPDETKEAKGLPVEKRLERRGPMTDEFLVGVFRASKALRSYLDDVAEYLGARELAGERIPGLKLVLGREGNRAWTDEEAVDKWLAGHLKQKERYDFKLKGPAKIETLLKDKLENTRTRNKFESLITRSPAKKVLAQHHQSPTRQGPANKRRRQRKTKIRNTNMSAELKDGQVMIPNSRIGYPKLFHPEAIKHMPDSRPRYGCQIYLPKSDESTRAKINEIIRGIVKDQLKGVMPKAADLCYKDGDEDGDENTKGHVLISANRQESQGRPQVIDRAASGAAPRAAA